jgi:hypothetical protein
MRTTIDLPENLHQVAKSLARHTGRTLSEAVADLMQRGLSAPSVAAGADFETHPVTGLPRVRSARPVTAADVAALEDEA